MNCTLPVAWDDRLSAYDFGPDHPMAPLRLKLTMDLAGAFGPGGLWTFGPDSAERCVLG